MKIKERQLSTVNCQPSTGTSQLLEENSTADLPVGVIMAVRGTAGTAGTINANRRLYPPAVYRKVIRQFNSREPREEMLGELDHPELFGGPKLEKTAFHITRLSLRDDADLIFEAHVLGTPAGRILAKLIEAGIPVNVS